MTPKARKAWSNVLLIHPDSAHMLLTFFPSFYSVPYLLGAFCLVLFLANLRNIRRKWIL